MKIVFDYPPNIKEIRKAFDIEGKAVVFAYGDTLYNPKKAEISFDLLAHEQVHSKQHSEYQGGASAWWSEYIANKQFRLSQEVEAYRKQWQVFCSKKTDRSDRRRFIKRIAGDLSSRIYGNVVSYDEAVDLIKAL
jgi:hypothetical protein